MAKLQLDGIFALGLVASLCLALPCPARQLTNKILWPRLSIYDLGSGPRQMHRGSCSQVIYNRESRVCRRSPIIGILETERVAKVHGQLTLTRGMPILT